MVSPVVAQAILGLKGPDLVGSFREGQEVARQEQTRELAGKATAGDAEAMRKLSGIAPEIALRLGEQIGARDAQDLKNFVVSAGITKRALESGQVNNALEFVNQHIQAVQMRGGNARPAMAIRDQIRRGDVSGAISSLNAFDDALNTARAATKSFAPIQFQKEDGTFGYGIPTFDPATGGTTFEEVSLPEGGEFVAKRETPEEAGQKVAAKEAAKGKVQLKYKPMIQRAVKEAETQAKSRGETLSEIGQMEAAMPGLREAVGQLKSLAPIATYTMTGKAFNAVAKELGFDATEGATARARFIATVNNQVLPLLKQTFGAAFTEREGDALRATMGDPDATPEEKIAQLNAFIEQKERDIQTRRAEAGLPAEPTQQAAETMPQGTKPQRSGQIKIRSIR